jgi:hypothetical protein
LNGKEVIGKERISTLWFAIINLMTNIEIKTEKGYKDATVSALISYETLFYQLTRKSQDKELTQKLFNCYISILEMRAEKRSLLCLASLTGAEIMHHVNALSSSTVSMMNTI